MFLVTVCQSVLGVPSVSFYPEKRKQRLTLKKMFRSLHGDKDLEYGRNTGENCCEPPLKYMFGKKRLLR